MEISFFNFPFFPLKFKGQSFQTPQFTPCPCRRVGDHASLVHQTQNTIGTESMQIRIQFGLFSRLNSFYLLLNPLCTQKPYLPKSITPTIEMVTESATKRQMCPKCSKPTQICLCTRLNNSALQNSIAVTILQHDLERKHPLNSTRIATIGLKNVSVLSVSDVNFQARFFIHLLEAADHSLDSSHLEEKSSDFSKSRSGKRKWDFVERPASLCASENNFDFGGFSGSLEEKSFDFAGEGIECRSSTKSSLQGKASLLANQGVNSELNIELGGKEGAGTWSICQLELGCSERGQNSASCTSAEVFPASNNPWSCCGPNGAVSGGSEDAVIAFTIEKYGAVKSFCGHWMLPEPDQYQKKDNFDNLLATKAAVESLAKGFVVKKVQTKQLNGTVNLEEFEEFEINVAPGSILLFPSEKSVGIESIDFEVKNLIVLDGTWAKAKRMYNENPWLKLLPHLQLDLDKLSLYREVRHQPRAGYLSTIESIVYALKALGEKSEKLNDLLDVFASMVGDQRRCKDERLSRVSAKPS